MNITIRGVNPQFWKALRLEAVKEDMTIGEAINLAVQQWIKERNETKKKNKKSFLELEPFDYKGEESRK